MPDNKSFVLFGRLLISDRNLGQSFAVSKSRVQLMNFILRYITKDFPHLHSRLCGKLLKSTPIHCCPGGLECFPWGSYMLAMDPS